MNPVLSICIPTYNRSKWLNKSLEIITNQLGSSNDDIEVIVTDNNSSDKTNEVIIKYLPNNYIKSYRNNSNIGAINNIKKAIGLSNGRYIWVLGDDDFIVPRFLEKILILLNKNSDIKFLFVKNSIWKPTDNDLINNFSRVNLLLEKHKIENQLEWIFIEKIAQIADPEHGFFNAINNIIMHQKHYSNALDIKLQINNEFTSIESTFPHSKYIAENLLSEPCIEIKSTGTLCSNKASWSKYRDITYLKWYPELHILMEKFGADRKKSRIGRKNILRSIDGSLTRALKGEIENIKFFSLIKFTCDNYTLPEFWRLLFRLAKRRLLSL